jgi:hypothetical protein
MQHYSGRDPARLYRLESWKRRVGDRLLAEFSDDDVFHELEAVASEPARVFMGVDADGRRIYRAKKTPKAPATINAYANSLAAVMTWCIKKRRVPKSFENPCRKVERLPSRPGVVRFLSDDERMRLLAYMLGLIQWFQSSWSDGKILKHGQKQKPRHACGVNRDSGTYCQCRLRRLAKASPVKARARSVSVAGSGTWPKFTSRLTMVSWVKGSPCQFTKMSEAECGV